MKTHELKTVNPFFQDVWDGRKTFEMRVDDRLFRLGDRLLLKEYDKDKGYYSGRIVHAEVNHILTAADFPEGLREGYICMSIKVLDWTSAGTRQESDIMNGYTLAGNIAENLNALGISVVGSVCPTSRGILVNFRWEIDGQKLSEAYTIDGQQLREQKEYWSNEIEQNIIGSFGDLGLLEAHSRTRQAPPSRN